MLLKGKSIIIVEDNAQNRVIFQMALIRHGPLIAFERWGAGTMAVLNGFAYVDLIILDLMLAEGVSGFDIYDQIRTLPKYNQVPIIAVSAMDPAIAIPRARAKGFAGFIAKPIDKHLFAQQLVEIIEGIPVWYVGSRDLTS